MESVALGAEEGSMRTKSILLLSAFAAVIGLVAFGGDLDPPAGPIGPTMKTLDEVEPRTAIASLPFTITSPGSYYLTGDLSTAGNGVSVQARDVTIDMMGFTVTGPGPESGATGLFTSSASAENLTLRNGAFRSFENGVVVLFDEISENGSTIEHMRVLDVKHIGIDVRGVNNLVLNCFADRSSVPAQFLSTGIVATGGVIKGCRARGFHNGISGTNGVVITECIAIGGERGIVCAEGIVRGCAVRGSSIESIFLIGDAIAVDNYAP